MTTGIVNQNKRVLFEYFVFELDKYCFDLNLDSRKVMTKLRLQKLLFFISTLFATKEDHVLLDVFDHFYALPYGPVEIDIYEMMASNRFEHISFDENVCVITNRNVTGFSNLPCEQRNALDLTLKHLKDGRGRLYLECPVFKLVDLSHRWSVWRIAMDYAHSVGHNKARISTDEILDSTKFFW